MNFCEWKLPNGQTFEIDVNTNVYDYLWGSIRYVGDRIEDCNSGNCLRTCTIEIGQAKKSLHKGMWTCISNVKVANGRYIDNINITFDQGIIGKKISSLIGNTGSPSLLWFFD